LTLINRFSVCADRIRVSLQCTNHMIRMWCTSPTMTRNRSITPPECRGCRSPRVPMHLLRPPILLIRLTTDPATQAMELLSSLMDLKQAITLSLLRRTIISPTLRRMALSHTLPPLNIHPLLFHLLLLSPMLALITTLRCQGNPLLLSPMPPLITTRLPTTLPISTLPCPVLATPPRTRPGPPATLPGRTKCSRRSDLDFNRTLFPNEMIRRKMSSKQENVRLLFLLHITFLSSCVTHLSKQTLKILREHSQTR
jgi:hypothetical protein